FAADIARVVAATAWLTAKAMGPAGPLQFAATRAQSEREDVGMSSREIDTGSFTRGTTRAATGGASASRLLRFNAQKVAGEPGPQALTPEALPAAAPAQSAAVPVTGSLMSRAVSIVRAERVRASGFAPQRADESEFIPDPVNQTTSS